MAFARPTLTELVTQISGDLASRFPGADSLLRRATLRVLAVVYAGAVYGLYSYLDWISLQVMPDTAEQAQLRRWASIWGVPPKAAVASSGPVEITGTNGSVVPAGTLLQTSNGGAEYATTADVTIVGVVGELAVQALAPGSAGNASPGVALTFVSPVPGVSTDAVVGADGLTGGVDEEKDPSLLARLLTRIRQPPQGGCAEDYVTWAMAWSAEVTRAWTLPAWTGLGTVGVIFVFDNRADIIPTGGDLTAFAAFVDPRRPVTADVVPFAPTAVALNPSLHINPDTADNRAAVLAELQDLLTREAGPDATLLLTHVRDAIGDAMSAGDYALASPSANVTYAANEVGVIGAVTWT